MSEMGRVAWRRAGEAARYGPENWSIAEALKRTRGLRRKCEAALAGLAYVERLEARAQARALEVGGMGDARYCQCAGGMTMDDALELSDDDEVEVLAVTAGPMLVGNQPLMFQRHQPAVPYVHGNFILQFPGASGDNSCGSVFNPTSPAADDEASS